MNIAISLAQFVILALGVMASRILVNSGAVAASATALSDRLTVFIANQGVWLLVIPATWLLCAEGCVKFKPSLAASVQASGVAVAVACLAAIVLVLAF